MTNSPDDQIDAYESRLARRVGAFAEQVVRPIDAAAIAAAARAGARRRGLLGRLFGSSGSTARLGIVIAGAALATALGVVLGGGGQAPAPSATAQVADASLQTTGVTPDCAAKDLSAEIVAWEGAAGHRIATVRFVDLNAECLIPSYLKPALVDGGGHALIVAGDVPKGPILHLSVGQQADALVDMTNYCGPAPVGELTLRMYLPTDDSITARRSANLAGPLDTPPCNGPTVPATIEMGSLGTIPGT